MITSRLLRTAMFLFMGALLVWTPATAMSRPVKAGQARAKKAAAAVPGKRKVARAKPARCGTTVITETRTTKKIIRNAPARRTGRKAQQARAARAAKAPKGKTARAPKAEKAPKAGKEAKVKAPRAGKVAKARTPRAGRPA